jgi:aspartyl protease family protein
MGLVRVTASIGPDAEHLRDVRFLVDTGAFYPAISASLARELNMEPTRTARIQEADGRGMNIGLSLDLIRVMERDVALAIAILDVPEPLLGITALEGLGLKVNPNTQTLEYDSPLSAPPMLSHFLEHRDD